jgi:hypothetical protein
MTEQWIPGDKKELMSAIEREWNLLMDAVAKLNATQMVAPDAGGWSPKDNLAHLSEWMKTLMGFHLDRRPADEVMHLPKSAVETWDMEVINPLLFERNRHRSTEEVLDEVKQVYLALYNKLQAMSFEDLLKPRNPDDPQKHPLLLWVLGDTTEHFSEHRQMIEKSL